MEMKGIPVITHDGDTPSFHADMILIPAGKWGIALLINTNSVLLGDNIRNLAAGVAGLLEGQQPASTPANYPSIFLYIFMVGFLGFEIFNLVRLAVTWHRTPKITGPSHTFRFWFKPCGLPLLIGLMAACWMLLAMPAMFQASWPVLLLHQPDLSWVILLGRTLALINGILRCSVNAWKLKQLKARR
jgi:hypothetical protein